MQHGETAVRVVHIQKAAYHIVAAGLREPGCLLDMPGVARREAGSQPVSPSAPSVLLLALPSALL